MSMNMRNGMPVLCARCGWEMVFFTRVELFDRKEDAENGLHVDVSMDDGVHPTHGRSMLRNFESELLNNPSWRRNGMRVYIRCEHCGKDSVLSLAAHKGFIFIKCGTDTGEMFDTSILTAGGAEAASEAEERIGSRYAEARPNGGSDDGRPPTDR